MNSVKAKILLINIVTLIEYLQYIQYICSMINKSKNWTILNDCIIRKKGSKYYNCKCTCGNIQDVYYLTLAKETTKACNKCSFKVNNIKLSESFINKSNENKSLNDISGTLYAHIKRKAKERNLDFNLSKDFLWNLYEKQNKKCALSGISITLSKEIKYSQYGDYKSGKPNWKIITASLDRIDSSKGYEEDNVQWIHKDINFMKNSYNQDYFVNLCMLISKNMLIPSQAKSTLLKGVETTGEVETS